MIDYTTSATSGGRRMILVRTLPTAAREPLSGTPIASSGVWSIEITSDNDRTFPVDVYVQRDDTPLGYKQIGRQSYLEDSRYELYSAITGRMVVWDHDQARQSQAVRLGTLNAIATGQTPFVVAGYRADDEISARYSSLGKSPAARCPSVACISDDSTVMHGVLSAGTHSGSSFAMNGTSVSAPQLTRWIAEAFAANYKVTPPQLRALLINAAKAPQNVPPIVRTEAVGAGLMPLPQISELKSGGAVRRV
jgi:hypothetical protein